ncbi:MAG: EamA family transporter RarD [Spirochaetales bacterium]
MDERSTESRRQMLGTASAFSAFLLWGLLPFYWKWLGAVSAPEILAHRIVWSSLLLAIIVPISQRRELSEAIRDRRALLIAAGAGVVIGINWFIYTWAVGAERLVEASLGYYINPLVSVFLGVVVLRERLTPAQLVALLLAAAGVLVLAVSYGRIPWVSLGLAFSFGFYGLVKKVGRLNSVMSLFVELSVLAPIALVHLLARHDAGTGAFGAAGQRITWLLAGTGIVTIIPLLLFGAGARRIPLSRVGFLQYVAPTLMLLIGTLFYGEPFTPVHIASFALIWSALAIYTTTLVPRRRRPCDARAAT